MCNQVIGQNNIGEPRPSPHGSVKRMDKFQPPQAFDFSDSTSWIDWLEQHKQFRLLRKGRKDEGEVQIASLLYTMGPQANIVFEQLSFDEDAHRTDFAKVTEALTKHFSPVTNVVHERTMFERAVQLPTESLDEVLPRLHKITDRCEFAASREDRIRDRFMWALLAKPTSQLSQFSAPPF